MARCKYGKLKSPARGRRCKRRRSSGRRTRRSRRSSSSRRGLKIAGFSAGTLAMAGLVGLGVYKYWESTGA